MNAALQPLRDYRIIWRVTTTQRDPHTVRVMRLVALFTLLCLAGWAVYGLARHRVDLLVMLRAFLGVAMLWLATAWVFLFVPASVRLNSAANARLLPRQHRRVQQMAAGGWLLATLGGALAIGNWGALPMVGLYLIGMALVRAGYRAAVAPLVVAGNLPLLARHLPAALVDAAQGNQVLVIGGLLLLAAGAWALQLLYPAGGDAHLDGRAEQLGRMRRLERRSFVDVHADGNMRRWGSLRVYAAALRRDCRARKADALLMHVLGPSAHWSAWIGTVAVMLLVGLGVRLVLVYAGATSLDELMHGFDAIGLGTLVLVVMFSTAQYTQQLRRTRGEQALLRLSPRCGDAALLNRRLATQLLRRALVNWLALTAAVLALALLVGAGADGLLREFGLCCLAGQVAALGLLGDHARDAGWNAMRVLGAGLLVAVEAGLAAVLSAATGIPGWAWVTAFAFIVGGALLRGDWRRMLAASPAFPARRFE